MALELRQQLKLSQQLVMTPQLQQAIKLLQLSRLELLDTVQQELLENPMLEEQAADADLQAEQAQDRTELETRVSDNGDMDSAMESELMKNADWEDYLGDFSSQAKQAQVREAEMPEEGLSFEARLSAKPSLEGHLSWQLRLADFSTLQVAIGEAVINSLTPAGYLQADNEEIATMTNSTPEEVEDVVKRIQRFDPVGVASRTPQECLLTQLEVYEHDDPILFSLVRDHLEDLEKRRYKPLARKFKISLEELKDYLDMLQTLDPMPGANYASSEPQYVSPDAYVYKFNDQFIIMLNEEGMPKLQLNSMYMDSLQGVGSSDKDYFQEKMRSAVWLMKSLYQRQRTLYKVIESILRFQHEFFEQGVTQLKPLILKDVADDISMHESTVSRITTSKYLATPHGIFELKFFFNSALELDDGTQVGSESVKALIKSLISDEDPKKPLSDERIADILKDKLQVNIARRTVAKYRSALKIPSSSKRKQIL